MHRIRTPFSTTLLLLSGLLLVVAGCSDDSPTAPTASPDPTAFRADASIDLDGSDFEIRTEDPATGRRFLISGSNLRRDEGALAVDVVVTNEGSEALRLPATFTLVSLMPDTVRVLGADNGETGAGAAFDLHFTERDTGWQPGESSQPLTLRFDVAEGVSLGFVVRIDVEMSATGGAIGGMVFEDLDADGVLDPEETGIGGVRIRLVDSDGETRAVGTAPDGMYRFDGLEAGLYTVQKAPQQGLAPTTPAEQQVLLVDDGEGGVSDYLMANFGCLFAPEEPRRELEVGDAVEVTGRYHAEAGQLLAYEVEWESGDVHAELRGPVTAVVDTNGVFEIMGVALHSGDAEIEGGGPRDWCQDRRASDVELGERMRARLFVPEDEEMLPTVERLKCWSGDKDKVSGHVESIERGEDDEPVSFVVAGLTVAVGERTRFGDDHDDDDDDDDDYDDDDGDDDDDDDHGEDDDDDDDDR